MLGDIQDLNMPKVFFTREGQQMVQVPGPVIYLEVKPEIWDSDAKLRLSSMGPGPTFGTLSQRLGF